MGAGDLGDVRPWKKIHVLKNTINDNKYINNKNRETDRGDCYRGDWGDVPLENRVGAFLRNYICIINKNNFKIKLANVFYFILWSKDDIKSD